MPGQRLLLWYADDHVWHERVLLWPTGRQGTRVWAIATPDWADDGGVYVEDLTVGPDVSALQPLALDGTRPYLDEEIYAFPNVFTDEELGALIGRGRDAARAQADAGGLDSPSQFLSWGTGDFKALPADLRSGPRRPKQPAIADRPAPRDADRRDTPLRDPHAGGKPPEGPWALALPVAGLAVGDAIEIDEFATYETMGDKLLLKLISGPAAGETAVLQRARGLDRERFRAAMRDMASEEFGIYPRTAPVPGAKEAAPAKPSPEDDPDDARVLGIDYNRRKQRHKPFADGVSEQVEDVYADWPIYDGHRSMLWVLEKMARDGLAPVAWCESYLGRKRYADADRAQHELRVLAKVIETALCYDQLNVCGLAAFEHLARRWQLIIGAHAKDPLNPNYHGSEHYGGEDEGDDCVAPTLREKVVKGIESNARVLKAQNKAAELKAKLPRKPKGAGRGSGEPPP